MSLKPGQALSNYEVLAPLGAGGMGEVWRAKDSGLDREVAIKVLPTELSEDEDLVRRFAREARTLAALNHPNVAHIYGFDRDQDVCFIAMELVPGEDLATRLAAGPLPIDEATDVCRQIAEGLEAAHEMGIVHRDLKPANVRLTPDGVAKVLDFGLAKSTGGDSRAESSEDDRFFVSFNSELAAGPAPSSAATEDSFEMTREGVVLGTPTYMSPEQARGKPVDRRTDIWAFGCVLFECLTGMRAFTGETFSDVTTAIISDEPDWAALPEMTPPHLRDLMERTLDKNPRSRLRDVGEARILLERAHTHDAAPIRSSRGSRTTVYFVLLAIVIAILGFVIGRMTYESESTMPEMRSAADQSYRFTVKAPPGVSELWDPVVSRDGQRLIFRGFDGASWKLYLREFDEFESRVIKGTNGADAPFLSPDGQWVGFFVAGKMKKVALTGGDPLTITEVDSINGSPGAVWLNDDTILFSRNWLTGFSRVSASGGMPGLVTSIDESSGEKGHWWPVPLPDGNAVLFTIFTAGTGMNDSQAAILDLEKRTWKTLFRGAHARFAAPDRIIYSHAGSCYSVQFDPIGQRVTGTPRLLDEKIIGLHPNGSNENGLSIAAGVMAFVPGCEFSPFATPVWVSRDGAIEPALSEARPIYSLKLSPDNQRLMTSEIAQGIFQIDIHDLKRSTSERIPLAGSCFQPVWHRDGERIIFNAMRNGDFDVFMARVDGTEEVALFSEDPDEEVTDGFRDRDSILVNISSQRESAPPHVVFDLRTGDKRALEFLPEDAEIVVSSREGRFLAYQRYVNGRTEIYVQRTDGSGSRVRASSAGGEKPVFSPAADELFFSRGHDLVAVKFEGSSKVWKPTGELTLFSDKELMGASWGFDVSNDGSRFLMLKRAAPARTEIQVITDWAPDPAR